MACSYSFLDGIGTIENNDSIGNILAFALLDQPGPVNPVPGPLPLLGAAAAFGVSRRRIRLAGPAGRGSRGRDGDGPSRLRAPPRWMWFCMAATVRHRAGCSSLCWAACATWRAVHGNHVGKALRCLHQGPAEPADGDGTGTEVLRRQGVHGRESSHSTSAMPRKSLSMVCSLAC